MERDRKENIKVETDTGRQRGEEREEEEEDGERSSLSITKDPKSHLIKTKMTYCSLRKVYKSLRWFRNML